MLVHNGFVVEGNRNDSLVLRLGVSNKDELAAGKNDLLGRLGISPHGHFVLKEGSHT